MESHLDILGLTPFFSSRQFMVTGKVAELEAVPQAVVMAPVILEMKLNKEFKFPYIMNPCLPEGKFSADYEVDERQDDKTIEAYLAQVSGREGRRQTYLVEPIAPNLGGPSGLSRRAKF